MIPILTDARDLDAMRAACRLSAEILAEVIAEVKAGVTTGELDVYAADRMRARGVESAFYRYGGFPGYCCISINEEVVHGIPGGRVINEGDLVSVDLGVKTRGFNGDNAASVCVGRCDPEVVRLNEVCRESLRAGLDAARAGNRVGDIGAAVQKVAEGAGFGVVRDYCGHGVGRHLHEEPNIPNFGRAGKGPLLKEGMCLAIEPMITLGTFRVEVLDNDWTVVTRDGKAASHWENTVLVRAHGAPEILTRAGGGA